MKRILLLPFAILNALIRLISYSKIANEIRVNNLRFLGANIGKNVRIRKDCIFKGIKNISIGDRTYVGEGTIIVGYGAKVKIGNDVLIAENCYISSRNHRFRDKTSTIISQGYKPSDVTIENNVWLGHGSSISAGSYIKSGTVVSANTLARKDSPKGYVIDKNKVETIDY